MIPENKIVISCFSSEELYITMYRAEQKGAYVAHIRGELCSTVDDFFREISSAMRFPYYFGWNWAAFDECITDLEWLNFSSLFIVIDNQKSLFSKEYAPHIVRNTLIKYLGLAIEYWESHNMPISVFLNQK